jgi:methylated-DNA-[protein]-cysteine S-methyltransferase
MNNIFFSFLSSPIGIIKIIATEKAIISIDFMDENDKLAKENNTELTELCRFQLDEYFKGTRKIFDIPYLASGTDFQLQVWNLVNEIGYGRTASYLDISKKLGDVNKVRAVGTANGANLLPIIIPCHRIIGDNGKLIGYSGGLWRKQWLLEYENKNLYGQLQLF